MPFIKNDVTAVGEVNLVKQYNIMNISDSFNLCLHLLKFLLLERSSKYFVGDFW